MSGYLNRLIMRTQAANKSHSLRPFVRSRSPIAEQDQRLGVAGFEDVENSILPLADADTGQEWGEVAEAQAPMTPNITASRDVTVQRKIADSATPVSSIASNATSAKMRATSDLPSAELRADRSSPPEFSEVVRTEPISKSSGESGASLSGDRHRESTATPSPPMFSEVVPTEPLSKSSSESGTSLPDDRHQDFTVLPSPPLTGESGSQQHGCEQVRQLQNVVGQPQPRQTSVLPEMSTIAIESPVVGETAEPTVTVETTNAVAKAKSSAAAPVSPPIALPSLRSSETGEVEQQSANLDDIRLRTILQERQANVPSLEPSILSLAERDELGFGDVTASNIDQKESPRVAIGRINVEVVPQTATEATVTTSRSEPLTAASVSVIGPLGGGISSNLWLSLKQR